MELQLQDVAAFMGNSQVCTLLSSLCPFFFPCKIVEWSITLVLNLQHKIHTWPANTCWIAVASSKITNLQSGTNASGL